MSTPDARASRFVVREVLGTGGQGTVERVYDRERGLELARKRVHLGAIDREAAAKREFRALADLVHPNLVRILEIVASDDAPFTLELCMEWLPGEDLRRTAARLAPEERRALAPRVLRQLASGLACLHGAGWVHGDVKPENAVYLPDESRVVLVDLGLTDAHGGESSTRLRGSLAYLAPEVLRGAAVTPASDVHALGVTIYEWLAGRRPFLEEGRALAARRVREMPPPLGSLVPELDPAFAALVDAMLRIDAEHRPTSRELAGDVAPSEAPVFVGRARELAAIDDAYEHALRGRVSAVRLIGPSGVGKSALLAQARARLSARAVDPPRWLASRCRLDERLGYRTIDAWIDGLARIVERAPDDAHGRALLAHAARAGAAFPSLAAAASSTAAEGWGADDVETRRVVSEAFVRLVELVSEEQPLALVVDDVQWAELDGLALLDHLLRRGRGRILVVIAMRPPAPDDPLGLERWKDGAGAEGFARLRTIRLDGLDEGSARTLVDALLPREGTSTDVVDAIVRDAGGHPFLLATLAAGARDGHATRVAGADALLRERLSHLPDDAREPLDMLCVSGIPLAAAELRRLVSARLAPRWTAEMLAARWIKRSDGSQEERFEPYHDAVREAVLAALEPAQALACHRALAREWERVGASPERQLPHRIAIGDRSAACELARRAAEEANARFAFRRAYALFLRAIELGDESAGAFERAGTAAERAGLGEESARALLRAASMRTGVEARALRRRAGAQLVRCGRVRDGLSVIDGVARELGMHLPRARVGLLASAVAQRARLRARGLTLGTPPKNVDPRRIERIDLGLDTAVGLAMIDSPRAAQSLGRALVDALDVGDARRASACLGFETAFHGNGGTRTRTRTSELGRRALELAERSGGAYERACALGGLGIARFHLGDYAVAVRRCDAASRIFREECIGVVKERFTIELFALGATAMRGRFEELARRCDRAMDDAVSRGDAYGLANLWTGLPSLRHLADDRLDVARQELLRERVGFEVEGVVVQHFFDGMAAVHLHLYADEPEHAFERALAMHATLRRSLLFRTQWIRLYVPWLVARAGLALLPRLGRTAAEHRARVASALAAAGREASRWSTPSVDALAAGLALHDRDRDAAERLLERAWRGFVGADMAAHAASASLALGRLRGDDARVAAAHRDARALGVRCPSRMARLHVPWDDGRLAPRPIERRGLVGNDDEPSSPFTGHRPESE